MWDLGLNRSTFVWKKYRTKKQKITLFIFNLEASALKSIEYFFFLMNAGQFLNWIFTNYAFLSWKNQFQNDFFNYFGQKTLPSKIDLNALAFQTWIKLQKEALLIYIKTLFKLAPLLLIWPFALLLALKVKYRL